MIIEMDLSPSSIRSAANELKKYADHLKACESHIAERLSDEAAEEAAEYFDDGVSVEALANGVRATGESVVFQEFGAGLTISDPFPDGADVSFQIRRGAYSDLHQGEYAQTGYELWHHDGIEYRYVIPKHGLFYAMMRAKERAKDVAKEVLKGT